MNMIQSDPLLSTYVVPCREKLDTIEFFPGLCDDGTSLVALGGENYVTFSILHFPEVEPELNEFPLEHLTDVRHGCSIQTISWSPQTSTHKHPVNITFCTGGNDKTVRIFSIDFKMQATQQILGTHNSFINEVAIEPLIGKQAASVGDDNKCKIWDLESGKQQASIPLSSAGVSVKWNKHEQGKFMVAEQSGKIRFYDITSMRPIMSLNVGLKPIFSADWSPVNPLKVGAVAGNDWYIWDVSKSSLPEVSGQAHSSTGKLFRWCTISEELFATRGLPNNQVKLHHIQHEQNPVSANLKLGGGLSWHPVIPVCAAGADKLHLWNVEI